MSYQAFYRTYRPQKFSQVVGQTAIIKTLKNALSENKIGHAYLFSGPRGTGKTTMARLFAKALNCEHGIGEECDECQNCIAIKNGSHPDVFEIDAASNSGVDSVRDLIDQVRYQPILGRYKVYIIDEVHNMSSSAFNALLKTLEEPPANVVFILATTEPQKVLPTILSRVQRFDFTKVSPSDLVDKMEEVLESEGVEHDEKSLELIARLADGGVRDALSILEQVVSYAGDEITVDDVNSLFGLINIQDKLELVREIGKKDLSKVLITIKDMYDNGIDILRLHDDLIQVFKDLLIFGMTKDESLLTVLKPEEALHTLITGKEIRRALDILSESRREYRRVNNAYDHFELTMIKLCSSVEEKPVQVVAPVQPHVEPTPTKVNMTGPVIPEKEPVKEAPVPTSVKKEEPVKPIVNNVDFSLDGPKLALSDDDVIQVMVQGNKNAKIKLVNDWNKLNSPDVILQYGQAAAVLNSTTPRIVGANILVVEVQFESEGRKINLISNQKNFQKVMQDLFQISPYVYAISSLEYIRLVKKFQNLQQANKLPKPEPLDFDKLTKN